MPPTSINHTPAAPASSLLLQEYSRQVSSKSQTAGVPDLPRAGRRRGAQKCPHAIAAANEAVQIRKITPSVLAHERDDAVQRRDRELLVAQDVVVRMLRPHADARREI